MQLSAKRFVSVQMFRGRCLVSIREYYDDESGERRPGKKGEEERVVEKLLNDCSRICRYLTHSRTMGKTERSYSSN